LGGLSKEWSVSFFTKIGAAIGRPCFVMFMVWEAADGQWSPLQNMVAQNEFRRNLKKVY